MSVKRKLNDITGSLALEHLLLVAGAALLAAAGMSVFFETMGDYFQGFNESTYEEPA